MLDDIPSNEQGGGGTDIEWCYRPICVALKTPFILGLFCSSQDPSADRFRHESVHKTVNRPTPVER